METGPHGVPASGPGAPGARGVRAATAPFGLDRPASLVVIAFLLAAVGLWYSNLSPSFSQLWVVVPVYVLGVALHVAVLGRRPGARPWQLGREAWVVIITSCSCLALLWYGGRGPSYPFWFGQAELPGQLAPLSSFFFYSGCAVVARTVVPLAVSKLLLGRGPADYGYRLRGTFELWWAYVAALAVGLAGVLYASRLPSFLQQYPRCNYAITDGRLALGIFVPYQLAYGLMFGSGEAFWRGYILFGLERRLGANALFMMIIPYVIAHFGKPLPETLGAILAGLFLGYLALRHRSFWLGVVVHWGVALSMDLAALWRLGVVLG